MPLGIVSDDDWEKELLSHGKSITRHEIEKGRGEGKKEVPSMVREIIAESSILGEKPEDIMNVFPVSRSSISAYKRGVTSTAGYNGKKDNRLEKVRKRISHKAGNRVVDALNALENKDLNVESARDVSAIAKDMAVVFEKLSPVISAERDNNGRELHVHLYAPKMKKVEDYDIIDV